MFDNIKANAKAKATAAKETVKQKAVDGLEWVCDNKEITVALIGVGGVVLGKAFSVGKELARGNRVRRLERMQDNRVWDPSTGHFWQLKRRLDRNEQLYLERELARGRTRGKILSELGVLK